MSRSVASTFIAALGLGLIMGFAGPAWAQDNPDLRIIGGGRAKAGAFPAMAAMMINDRFACGGTLVGKNWVVTAGHCVKTSSGAIRAPSTLTVRMGTATLPSPGGTGGTLIPIKQVLPHPEYDPATMRNDIALLELAQPSNEPRQLLLSSGLAEQLVRPGALATVAGWGRTAEAGDVSTALMQVSVPVVAREQCAKAYVSSKPGINEHNVCAGLDAGGKDSCQGDSGGPLFLALPASGSVQVGVVSWGQGCAQPGKYGVYTAVADFETFLRQHVPDISFTAQGPASTQPGATAAVAAAQPTTLLPPGLIRQLTLDVDPTGPIKLGQSITLKLRSTDPGTLLVFSRDAKGNATQLFPNKFATGSRAQIAADVLLTIPAPDDRFTITAAPPIGDYDLMALVAPPGAKVTDLASVHLGLQTISDAATFFAELSKRLTEARVNEPFTLPRNLEIVEKQPVPVPAGDQDSRPSPPSIQGLQPIATATRRFRIVQ